MIAGQLAVTAEAFEQTGTTVSLNVVPLVVEGAVSPRVGIRGTTIVNAQVAGPDTGLSHRGAGLTVPIYLGGSGELPRHQKGWYAGPFVSVTANPLVDGWDLTTSAEGGVRWRLGKRGHLNLCAQLGTSRLTRPESTDWVPHMGFYPSLGAWVR